MPGPVGAVIVDHDAGPLLTECVRSLLDDGASPVVVVDNGAPGSARRALGPLLAEPGAAGRGGGAAREEPRIRVGGQPGTGGARRHDAPAGVGAGLQPRPARPPRSPRRTACASSRRGRPGPWWGPGSSPKRATSTRRCAASPPSSTPPATPSWRSSCPRTGSPGATTPAPPRATASSRPDGSPDRASWPGVTPSRSSAASTSRTSCTPRTWTCAGAPIRPGGASGSPGRPA